MWSGRDYEFRICAAIPGSGSDNLLFPHRAWSREPRAEMRNAKCRMRNAAESREPGTRAAAWVAASRDEEQGHAKGPFECGVSDGAWASSDAEPEFWIAHSLSQRQEFHPILKVLRLACLCHEFQIANALPDGDSQGVSIDNSAERLSLRLPLHGLQEQVVIEGEEDAAKLGGSLQQRGIRQCPGAVFLRREHIHGPHAESKGNSSRNMGIHVEGDRHLEQPLGSESCDQWRRLRPCRCLKRLDPL